MERHVYECETCHGKVIWTNSIVEIEFNGRIIDTGNVLECEGCRAYYVVFGETWVKAKRDFSIIERINKLKEYERSPRPEDGHCCLAGA